MKKVVIITGASRGFGELIAKKFQKENFQVIATMRNVDSSPSLKELDNVDIKKLDVTNKSDIKDVVDFTIEKYGRVDVLINNAGYGAFGFLEEASNEEIMLAAKNSYADEFIQKLPNGYDTIIGENGVRLSGGEKQRLSIARAMLKKSSIILLDEATSSLDSDTEEKIQNAISLLTKNKTTLVIAHRLSTILNANVIYVVKEGKIVTNGSHKELLSNSEIYKNFYEKQLKKS